MSSSSSRWIRLLAAGMLLTGCKYPPIDDIDLGPPQRTEVVFDSFAWTPSPLPAERPVSNARQRAFQALGGHGTVNGQAGRISARFLDNQGCAEKAARAQEEGHGLRLTGPGWITMAAMPMIACYPGGPTQGGGSAGGSPGTIEPGGTISSPTNPGVDDPKLPENPGTNMPTIPVEPPCPPVEGFYEVLFERLISCELVDRPKPEPL